jgi:hypothetical protein
MLKVIKAIQNKEAFNFDKQGKALSFNQGYMVGGFHKCLKVKQDNLKELKKAINEMLEILDQCFNSDYVLGWWDHEGFIYLDISKNVLKLDLAKKIGIYQNQKAIFDIKEGKEIFL